MPSHRYTRKPRCFTSRSAARRRALGIVAAVLALLNALNANAHPGAIDEQAPQLTATPLSAPLINHASPAESAVVAQGAPAGRSRLAWGLAVALVALALNPGKTSRNQAGRSKTQEIHHAPDPR